MENGAMCIICNGGSLDDVVAHVADAVARDGWTLMPVDGEPGSPSWAYTIGLADHDHPELVVTDPDLEVGIETLDHLARRVCTGERFDSEAETRCDWAPGLGFDVGLIDVHPAQVGHGVVNVWLAYYAQRGAPGPAPSPRIRQVVLPDSACCHVHQETQPLLDTAADVLHVQTLNRAARRAERRAVRRLGGHRGKWR